MTQLNIAVVGSGISGLSAAWLLSRRHNVTLYEADDRLGGHTNTVDVDTPDGSVAIDTGFIVYNQSNYPNLSALFQHLDIASVPTDMGFSMSIDNGAYEYSGTGAAGYFGQLRNLARPRHWRLLAEISRFFKTALKHIATYPEGVTLGEFLAAETYSDFFVQDHILPMGAAIWSTPVNHMLAFPARSFIEFYANHGLMQFSNRPVWRTVEGGSRRYIDRLLETGQFEVRLCARVHRVVRTDNQAEITDGQGSVQTYDHVVIAAHADQALAMLDQPTAQERELLGHFEYQPNVAVLHRDARWMPKRKRIWTSWNYLRKDISGGGLCVSYWMNELQQLNTSTDFFVTLNPDGEIPADLTHAVCRYDHPGFTAKAMAARHNLWDLQGERRTWFCGSYFGAGFHEDGLQSGLAVAEQLGGVRRPWEVNAESGRISIAGDATPQAAE